MPILRGVFFAFAFLSLGFLGGVGLAQDKAANLEQPIFITSSGQALDAFTIKTLLGRAGVEAQYDPIVVADKLTGVKTLVIAMGASVKGFGAAGITAETEIARTKALIEAAKAAGIVIVGVHIGGEDRRGGISEQFVELVAPASDRLIVWKDGDADGYFAKLAADKDIPLTVIDLPLGVGKALAAQVTGAT